MTAISVRAMEPLHHNPFFNQFEPFHAEIESEYANMSPPHSVERQKPSGVQINLQGHGDGLLNYYLHQDEYKNNNSLTALFNPDNFMPSLFNQQTPHPGQP